MRSVVVVVCVALRLAVAVADEGDSKARARALFRDATRSYDLAEFKPALDGFKEGYRVSGDPAFLFNIGQCYRQLGDPTNAAKAYRAFLRNKPDAANRAEVEQRIVDMDRAASEEQARKPPIQIEAPQVEAAPAATHVAAALEASPIEPAHADEATPVYKRWWLWTAVGVVVVGAAVAVAIAATTPSDAAVPANDGAAAVRF